MSTVGLRLRACAKINWAIEVLGRRPDGYHEIRTVLQTIALWDDVELRHGGTGVSIDAPAGWAVPAGDENIAERARRLYADQQVAAAVFLHLVKRVPAAAGLGGGSSDAAAVLRGLNRLSQTPAPSQRLAALAGSLGADVPFFLRGGAQLAAGRGELLTPLPDGRPCWLVLVTPSIAIERKTARLYALLGAADFSSGARVLALAETLRRGWVPRAEQCVNSFDRVALLAFDGLALYREALTSRCGHAILCGAGPSLFALMPSHTDARAAVDALTRAGVPAVVTSTLAASASTAARRVNEPKPIGIIE